MPSKVWHEITYPVMIYPQLVFNSLVPGRLGSVFKLKPKKIASSAVIEGAA